MDNENGLPRFNMPLELGVFVGAKRFGDSAQKNKKTLILDREPYRYQAFVSDIAGQDIKSHDADPAQAISMVRNWLNSASGRKTIPGGAAIKRRFDNFHDRLSEICEQAELEDHEVTYLDYCNFASDWLLS
ncbi:MAG: hypothetical protein AAFZ58_07030 [Pseudomonadota bacterium]